MNDNVMIDKLLPIGTVVSLKNAKTKLMIMSNRISVSRNGNEKIYDYLACDANEGITSKQSYLLLNGDQIDQIVYMGYTDDEWENYKKLNS